MKKILAFILVLCLCISLFACGKSENVKTVEEYINSLGAITLDSVGAVEIAKQAYDALNDNEKAKVENYTVLEFAITEISELTEAKNKELYDQALLLEKTNRKQAYALYKQLPPEYSDVADKISNLENTKYKALPFSSDNPEQIMGEMNGLLILHNEYEFTLGLDDKIELTLVVMCEDCGSETIVTVSGEQDEVNEHGILQKFGYAVCKNRSCSRSTYLYGVNIYRQ